MKFKRNQALVFLGLLVLTLLYIFGHMFPMLEAHNEGKQDVLPSHCGIIGRGEAGQLKLELN